VFEEHISDAKKNEERSVLCQTLEYCERDEEGAVQLAW